MSPMFAERAICRVPGSSKLSGSLATSSSEVLSHAARSAIQYLIPQPACPSSRPQTEQMTTPPPVLLAELLHMASTCAISICAASSLSVAPPRPPSSESCRAVFAGTVPNPPPVRSNFWASRRSGARSTCAASRAPRRASPSPAILRASDAGDSGPAEFGVSRPEAPHSHLAKDAVESYLRRGAVRVRTLRQGPVGSPGAG
mmetsp:Transcript_11595/g.30768  ORF Transcript_11595/g.30768 Transcript_11595/m.30768 type:complete len:201 (-) Transcript_11595:57-659(-)